MENNNYKNKNELSRRDRTFGLFDPFFEDFFGFPNLSHEFREMDKVMKTDVHETEKNYQLEIELPGYDKNDINLELNNGYLTIQAKHDSETEETEKKHGYVRRERYFGSCSRTFYVGDIDEKDIEAKLDRGVLNLTIPKEKRVETKKRIEIK